MTPRSNSEFNHEVKRLDMTLKHMEDLIESIKTNRIKTQEEIRQAYLDLDSTDSSQGYISIQINSQIQEYGERHFDQLTRGLDKPYFARIDFKPEGNEEFKSYYIGKFSVLIQNDQDPLVIDWRSPVASLYYDSRLGEVEYQSVAETYRGELGLKRQLTIENGQLIGLLDIDLTTNDAFLQAALDAKVDQRLKDIATSIQSEQNRVIRADIHAPLIVQGVAGSGKTTIALHRIAYLIYTYEDRFIPENFLILAPNRLFINYISEALPELGVERVRQAPFIDFLFELIVKEARVKLVPPEEKLVTLLDRNLPTETRSNMILASEYKGSLSFKKALDYYVDQLEANYIPPVDFKLGEYMIFPAEEIRRVFLEEYTFLSLQQRIPMIEKILKHKLNSAEPGILQRVRNKFNRQIDKVEFAIGLTEEERRSTTTALIQQKNEILDHLSLKAKTAVKDYMSHFTKINLLKHYQQFLMEPVNFFLASEENLNLNQSALQALCHSTIELLNMKKVELEDLAALAYLKKRLLGYKDKFEIKHVFIDEAQDLSVLQFYVLREILNTDMFTLFGDLAQGIHSYRGLKRWSQVSEGVFPNLKCQFLTLEQSYRTTIEIMEHANSIIGQLENPEIVLAKPVLRHGSHPQEYIYTTIPEIVKTLEEEIEVLQGQGYQSIALIGKTLEECKLLKKHMSLDCGILHGDETLYEGKILLVPSYVAKGLEFDAVFIFNLYEHYSKEEFDLKLLYVAMTRARHRLYLLSLRDQKATTIIQA